MDTGVSVLCTSAPQAPAGCGPQGSPSLTSMPCCLGFSQVTVAVKDILAARGWCVGAALPRHPAHYSPTDLRDLVDRATVSTT
jgi:hypothetical protein